jgi:hypothetical protein
MNTTENNKLIAEFMGAVGTPKYNPTEWDVYLTGCLDVDSDDENAQHFYTPDEMKYHKSWNWLMPVISKCLEIGKNVPIERIYHSLHTQDLSFAYKSVVEFIKGRGLNSVSVTNNYEIETDNYIKWFKEENSDQYGELKWLIDLLLNSKHKDNIIDVLKTTNEDYVL